MFWFISFVNCYRFEKVNVFFYHLSLDMCIMYSRYMRKTLGALGGYFHG